MSDQSHAVSKPNKRPPTQIETFKASLVGDALKQITNYYDGDEQEALRFATAAVEYVRKVPKLLEVERTSLVMALVTAAQFRFLPSNVSGEGYIIPYGNEAKFQMGYQGYVTLLYRSGKVKSITAEIVYANDVFEYEAGLEPKLVHKPVLGERGDPIAVYTVVQLAGGGKSFKVMSKAEVMAIKNTSKAKGKSDSPWNSGDPLLGMWKKTCLIQHQKFLPKTPDIVRALEVDYEGEGMERPMFDAGGPATARALHAPDVQTLPEEELCPAGLHPKSEVDADGDCKSCVAEALEAEGGKDIQA